MAIYTETVERFVTIEREESVDVPDGLVKLVNGRDKKFGANGYRYMGCQRRHQGGTTIGRLSAYLHFHQMYHVEYKHPCDCPIVPPTKAG